jgi:hypothetical protein
MENTPQNYKSIRDKVLESIKRGEVAMRPRWHFVLKGALVFVGAIITFSTLLYLVSFIIFVLHRSGMWFVPIFGLPGLYAFLIFFPWRLLVWVAIFIIILEILVRHYAFAYRRPLLYSAIGVLMAVLVGGFIVARTSLQNKLFVYAEAGRLPVGGRFYREFGNREFRGVQVGKVIEVRDPEFIMQAIRPPHEGVLKVFVTPETRLPFGEGIFAGERVVVFGDREGNAIRAIGVKSIER